MMLTIKGAARALVVAVVAGGCPKAETPVQPVDHDGVGTDLGEACANLRVLRCPEGDPLREGRTCFEHLLDVVEQVPIPSTCVRAATSQAIVRTCGNPSTLRFRCVERLDAGADGGDAGNGG